MNLIGVRTLFPTFCLSGVLLLYGCTTVPETGRSQFNIMSADQEMQMGLTEFDKMKQEMKISQDPAINALVREVGQRIADVAPLPNAQWEFVVFDSEQANAFCLPGGKIGIFTGILPITKNKAGLATVMGHEVAHAVARHGGERISQAMMMQTGGQILGQYMSDKAQWQQVAVSSAYGLGAQVGVALPHGRSQEAEADYMGLIYMARAGYNPEEAVDFWQRFAEYGKQMGDNTPWFLRTHPMSEVRVENLKTWMPKALSEYRPQ